MSLEWREQLSVGNDVIDSDHKHLIEIINQVERSFGAKNRSELMLALDSLSHYSEVHFDREEKIASAVGYIPVPQLHKSHGALLIKLDKIKQGIGEEWTESSAEQLIVFLRSWLVDHLLKEDMLLKPALKKHPPDFNPANKISAEKLQAQALPATSPASTESVPKGLYINWKNENELGIQILDEQHRAIVATINSLFYFIQNGKGIDALRPTLNVLDQYTKLHFETEEELIKQEGYPGFDAHVLLHQELVKKMTNVMRESISKGDPTVVLAFLGEWWMSHINKEDKEYAAFMGSIPQATC